jgi:hypothetical protein
MHQGTRNRLIAMKKDSAKKPAATPAKPVPEKAPAKPAGRAKASMKAAVSKVTTGAKKAVSKATASVKKRVTRKPAETTTGAPATIVVRHDAGWGNSVALRGEGPGLSWDSGTPMCCVNGVEWVWVAPAAGTVVFKVLHNDRAWALGENLVAAAGETVTVTPVF